MFPRTTTYVEGTNICFLELELFKELNMLPRTRTHQGVEYVS